MVILALGGPPMRPPVTELRPPGAAKAMVATSSAVSRSRIRPPIKRPRRRGRGARRPPEPPGPPGLTGGAGGGAITPAPPAPLALPEAQVLALPPLAAAVEAAGAAAPEAACAPPVPLAARSAAARPAAAPATPAAAILPEFEPRRRRLGTPGRTDWPDITSGAAGACEA